jgi:UDP-N-acetylmuramoyl-tripeptide--D-alanyl-D-alanine ligase
LRFDRLVTMTAGELITRRLADRRFTGVSTDSRTTREHELFIAIRGERVDGHEYIGQAVARGAAGVIAETGHIQTLNLPEHVAVISVADSHEAMMRLAREYVSSIPARRIGITGSNGKTTTKEFAYRLLTAVEHDVYKSPGNFNNLFGVPLALFAMPETTRVAVLEMGISTPGEMDRLAAIVRPHVVAITNVSATHLQFLGSVEVVAREKLRLLAHSIDAAPLIVNADDRLLMQEALRLRRDIVTFGIEQTAQFRPTSITQNQDGVSIITIDSDRFRLPLFGKYQVYNLLAAYAIVKTLGYSFDNIDTSEIELATAPMRGEILSIGGITIVADCYNANPESVRAGLQSFASYPAAGRRVIILGDMLELGEDAERFHREMGETLAAQVFDLAILVGPMSAHAYEAARAAGVSPGALMHFVSADSCSRQIVGLLQADDVVYLKGSRGIGLETVIQTWREAKESA